jgi:hypothetical protein
LDVGIAAQLAGFGTITGLPGLIPAAVIYGQAQLDGAGQIVVTASVVKRAIAALGGLGIIIAVGTVAGQAGRAVVSDEGLGIPVVWDSAVEVSSIADAGIGVAVVQDSDNG